MSDDHLRELYSETMDLSTSREEGTCPSPEELSGLIEGSNPESARLVIADHVMACRACQEEFELLRSLRAAAPKPRWGLKHLATAASVLLVAGAAALWTTLSRDGARGPVYRSGAPRVTLVSPAAGQEVTLPASFAWQELPGAIRYELELLDSVGSRTYSDSSSDTALSIPGTVPVGPGEYRWFVTAVFEDGTEIRSIPRVLIIQPQ